MGVSEKLRGKLVVSCQAAPDDPLENTETIRRMAQSVVTAGAAGLRINSPEHVAAVRAVLEVPIIGIQKRYCPGRVHITPDFESAAALAAAGASIIALDCTDRGWPDGEPWRILVKRIHSELKLAIMADVATLEEAVAAANAGADFVGTTLNGYTEQTRSDQFFNWSLLADMIRQVHVPVFAEGHISTPEEARRAIAMGAWCVIVGSAITRPGTITSSFVRAIEVGAATAPAIGVDIGGTCIKAGLVHTNGEVSLTAEIPTEAAKGRDAIAGGLCQAINQTLAAAHAKGIQPGGLGIASAGVMSVEDGSVFAATDNLPGWTGFNLRAFAAEQSHLPTYVVNDAHAAVLAELHFGLGRSLSSFVGITIGTGIGGGVVCNGRLLRGQHGFAGSIGHHVIRVGGRPCNCGRQGCLEAYVSTAALLKEFEEQGGVRSADPNLDDAAFALKINRLAISGSVAARKAYMALAGYLAEGIANLFNLFDPEAVFISGGLVEGQTQFVTEVAERVTTLLHFGSKRQPRIQTANAGRLAGVQGAGALVFEGQV